MTPAEWQRIKTVLAETWKQPAAERTAYAAKACGSDENLRAEVMLLLKSMTDAAELFETPEVLLRGEPDPAE